MKNIFVMISLSAAIFLVIASFPSSLATNENIDKKLGGNNLDILEQIKDEKHNTKWFPGFILVQLLKGIIGFVVILMVLLDLAEPDDSE